MTVRDAVSSSRSLRRLGCPRYQALWCSVLVLAMMPSVAANEITAFKLTDVSGEFSVNYFLDDWDDTNPDSDNAVDAATWTEQLIINTRSYIYHPAFLQIRIGGGPLWLQESYRSGPTDINNKDTLFNFNAALDFLSLRPYSFTLYYGREYPRISAGLSGSFLAASEVYGIKGLLRKPFSPLDVRWEAGRRESAGSGAGTRLDDMTDWLRMRTRLPYDDGEDPLRRVVIQS